MVWGTKSQNKVAEIHTHKPGKAGEATHCGLLVEKWWFESLELRKALRQGFICRCSGSILNRLPKYCLTLTWLQGHPAFKFIPQESTNCSPVQPLSLLHPTALEGYPSGRTFPDLQVHFYCRSFFYFFIDMVILYISHETNQQEEDVVLAVFNCDL